MEDQNNIPEDVLFPKTLKESIWTNYLGRKLNIEERYLFESYRTELKINQQLKQLYDVCVKKKNLYIPELTELDGDCLFSSLVYHGLARSVKELRNTISIIMYIYKDP